MAEIAATGRSLLEYPFRDPALRQAALTHRSAGSPHNERLEFLGDAVLNLVIAQALFERLPTADEGDLTRLRAYLVRGETLGQIAGEMQLGRELQMGLGEYKSGGHRRGSIQADALEALFGAILCDAGFTAARDEILRVFAPRLAELPSAHSLKDPKTRLQEWLQGRNRDLPEYELVHESGPPHRRVIAVRCRVGDEAEEVAQGSSRRGAEQDAARRMLERLGA